MAGVRVYQFRHPGTSTSNGGSDIGCLTSHPSSETLRKQAATNSKERFSDSPDLKQELMNAIIGALDAHTAMSTQALNSPGVQRGIRDILLNHAGLYEALRAEPRP